MHGGHKGRLGKWGNATCGSFDAPLFSFFWSGAIILTVWLQRVITVHSGCVTPLILPVVVLPVLCFSYPSVTPALPPNAAVKVGVDCAEVVSQRSSVNSSQENRGQLAPINSFNSFTLSCASCLSPHVTPLLLIGNENGIYL